MDSARPERTIDIRGAVCPMTFVRSKLAMEELGPGQVLEIITDYEPATRSIPKAMKEHGHEVLSLERLQDKCWTILIRKS